MHHASSGCFSSSKLIEQCPAAADPPGRANSTDRVGRLRYGIQSARYTKVQLCQKEETFKRGYPRQAVVGHIVPAKCRAPRPRKNASFNGVAELRVILNSPSPIMASVSAMIAHSQTVVTQPRAVPTLPAGFDYADITVLDWIATEERRLGRSLPPN